MIELLKQTLHYDPETGFWTRLATGKRVEHKVGPGYLGLIFNKKQYFAHRLAWFYMTGKWPVGIDHKNHDPKDNRWRNLREANQAQNGANHRLNKNNKSGYKGVHWSTERQRWVAQIKVKRKSTHLGRFRNKEEAARAYRTAAIFYFKEFSTW